VVGLIVVQEQERLSSMFCGVDEDGTKIQKRGCPRSAHKSKSKPIPHSQIPLKNTSCIRSLHSEHEAVLYQFQRRPI
jgi:deoxycytidylate deaminase